MRKLSTKWTSHLQKDEDRKNLTESVFNNNNNVVLLRLRAILREKETSILKAQHNAQDYSSPSWPMIQADFNGQLRMLEETLDLLAFLKDPFNK